jgi:hypothetical protein
MKTFSLPAFGRRAPVAPFEVRFTCASTGADVVQGFDNRVTAATVLARIVRTGTGYNGRIVAAI